MAHIEGETMPRSEQDFRDYIARKFREGDERMERIESNNLTLNKKMDENTALTNSIKADTAGLVSMWTVGSNVTKFGHVIGELSIWIIKAGLAMGALWAGIKYGLKS